MGTPGAPLLRQQYYRHPVLRLIRRCYLTALGCSSLKVGIAVGIAAGTLVAARARACLPSLEPKTAKVCLLLYLQCSGEVPSPKGLYQHDLLLQFLLAHGQAGRL